MFGSSQDRARQFAARKRRGRVSSSASLSSHRLVSSSSQVSQQSPITYLLDHTAEQPLVISEHLAYGAGLACCSRGLSAWPSPDQEISENPLSPPMISNTSQILTGGHRSPMEQHRLQAEHLSQVLYNSQPLSVIADPLPGSSKPSPQLNRYGSLGTQSATSYHLRSITAPLPPNLRLMTLVSIRGGHGSDEDGDPVSGHSGDAKLEMSNEVGGLDERPTNSLQGQMTNQSAPDTNIPSRSFATRFPWVPHVCGLPQWEAPVPIGITYHEFLHSLPRHHLATFVYLFDPRGKTKVMASAIATARKKFFRTLNRSQADDITAVISLRGEDLLRNNQNPAWLEAETRRMTPENEPRPYTTLYCLLEATEDLENARNFTSTQNTHILTSYGPYLFGPSPPFVTRGSSMPSLGEQQQADRPL